MFNNPDGRNVFDQQACIQKIPHYENILPSMPPDIFVSFITLTYFDITTLLWVRHDKDTGFKHRFNFLFLTLAHTHTHMHTFKHNKTSTITA